MLKRQKLFNLDALAPIQDVILPYFMCKFLDNFTVISCMLHAETNEIY